MVSQKAKFTQSKMKSVQYINKLIIKIMILCIQFGNNQVKNLKNTVMLGYKGYLEQSRARRGYTQFPVHYEIPEIKSNQNIKQFVATPNYGQIFYSQNGQPQQINVHLRSSLQSQKSKREQLFKYVNQLQQQNTMLKNRLNEVLQAQQLNSNPNINSQLNIKSNPSYYDGRIQPLYITSSIPTQNYIKQETVYQHAPHYSFTGNLQRGSPGQGNQVYVQQRQSVPVNSNPNLQNSLYQPKQRFTQSPVIPEQVSTQYLTEQQIYSQPQLQYDPQQSNQYIQPQYQHQHPHPQYNQPQYQFGIPSQSFPYRQSAQNIERSQSQSQRNMIQIARQKLNQIKDDDEELRAYTIKLLRRN